MNIDIGEVLEILSKHLKISRPEVFKQLKNHFSVADTSTLFGVLFELSKCKIEPDEIVLFISEYLNIPVEQMKSPLRKTELVQGRQISMFFIKHITSLSLKSNGAIFGGRDHTTALHNVQTVKNLFDTDPLYKEKIMAIAHGMYEKYFKK